MWFISSLASYLFICRGCSAKVIRLWTVRTTVPLETDGLLARRENGMDYPTSSINLGLSRTAWAFRSIVRSGLGWRVASYKSSHRFRWLINLRTGLGG